MLTVLIMILSAYRITHLVVFDKVFEPIRNLFVRRHYLAHEYGGFHVFFELQGGKVRRFIGQIMNCFWCAGVWVSAVVVALYVFGPTWITWVYIALAAAGVIGIIETWWTRAVGYPEMQPFDKGE